jgi:predicted DNA-binding transcriptional regulator AlpA
MERLLSESEAAQMTGFKPRTLQLWRMQGTGPDYIKISARAVRYQLSDLAAWVEKHRQTSTSDTAVVEAIETRSPKPAHPRPRNRQHRKPKVSRKTNRSAR